jgi:hypothetical protein
VAKNLKFEYQVPKKYNDRDFLILMIKELDEANAHVAEDTFDLIIAMKMMLKFDELQW